MTNAERFRPLAATMLATLVLAACASAPKPIDSLERARDDYNRVAADATIAKHAPEELDEAQRALKAADARWKGKESRTEIDHYVYIAAQRVKIAELIANAKEDGRELENMKLERQRVQLEVRASELDRSRAEVERSRAEIARAQAEAEELKRQMEELQARETERGMVLTLGDVLFETNESELASEAARSIDKIAEFMDIYPERRAIVEGHTDSMGDDDYNMDLSRDRAFAVRQALAARGISTSRITTQGFGENKPVASNETSAGRRENRRVEIIFPDSPMQVSALGN